MAKRNYCDENGRCRAGDKKESCSFYKGSMRADVCDICDHRDFLDAECTNPAAIQAAKEVNNG
jgi:hypothetical protein